MISGCHPDFFQSHWKMASVLRISALLIRAAKICSRIAIGRTTMSFRQTRPETQFARPVEPVAIHGQYRAYSISRQLVQSSSWGFPHHVSPPTPFCLAHLSVSARHSFPLHSVPASGRNLMQGPILWCMSWPSHWGMSLCWPQQTDVSACYPGWSQFLHHLCLWVAVLILLT